VVRLTHCVCGCPRSVNKPREYPIVPPGFVDRIVNKPWGNPPSLRGWLTDLALRCQRTQVRHPAIPRFVDTRAENYCLRRSVVGERGVLIGWDDFGMSAPNEVIGKRLGMKAEVVADEVESRLGGLEHLGSPAIPTLSRLSCAGRPSQEPRPGVGSLAS
jgi:hypothetical protein